MRWDAVLIGAGYAGVTLAYQLAHGPMAGGRILLIDPRGPRARDHTMAWWAEADAPHTTLAQHRWDALELVDAEGAVEGALGGLRYHLALEPGLRARLLEALISEGRVTCQRSRVVDVLDGVDAVRVVADGQVHEGTWAFDSRWAIPERVDPGRVLLLQSFRGWRVRTASATFTPSRAVLMDLRAEQEGALRFACVLPLAADEALVELVSVGAAAETPELAPWLAARGIVAAAVEEVERGVIPMTDQPTPRRAGRRVLRVGVAGGRVKPSSGYAFGRILRDAEAISASLARTGAPFALPEAGWRWRLLDAWMLRLMRDRPADAARALGALFRAAPLEVVLRFLDERAGVAEIVRLGLALPRRAMAAALARLVVDRVLRRG